jgi:hypothetical protein
MRTLLGAGVTIPPLEEFWARLMAWVMPNYEYVFADRSRSRYPHLHEVVTTWPEGMENTPAKLHIVYATGCTGVGLFVALLPFFVRQLRALPIISGLILAAVVAFLENFCRLVLLDLLKRLDFPRTGNPLEISELVHSGFSVATWLAVATGYAFVQWRRARSQRSAVSA